jgi:hypothetical protein
MHIYKYVFAYIFLYVYMYVCVYLHSIYIYMYVLKFSFMFIGVVQIDADTRIPYMVLDASRNMNSTNRFKPYFNLVVCNDLFDTAERMKIFLRPLVQKYTGFIFSWAECFGYLFSVCYIISVSLLFV